MRVEKRSPWQSRHDVGRFFTRNFGVSIAGGEGRGAAGPGSEGDDREINLRGLILYAFMGLIWLIRPSQDGT